MRITEAKEKLIIPREYWELFKDSCPYCGEELDITENRKTLTCPNPHCGNKQPKRLGNILCNFGLKGVKEGQATKLMDSLSAYDYFRKINGLEDKILDRMKLGYISPMEILFLPLERYPSNVSFHINKDRYDFIQNLKNTKITFAEVVSKLELPGIGTLALKAFKDCSSLEDLCKKTDNLKRVRTYVSQYVGYGENMYIIEEQILNNIRDLYLCENFFNYRKPAKDTLNIVVTGSIFRCGKQSRTEFNNMLNRLGEGKVRVIVGKAIESVSYIIADRDSNSVSYQAGVRREKEEGRKIIYHSDEFLEIFKERWDIGE